MKTNLLVVTDHRSHSESNSLYALCHALREDNRCHEIWVASQGVTENKAFFEGLAGAPIHAIRVSDSFRFDPEGVLFKDDSHMIRRENIGAILLRMPQPLNVFFLKSLTGIVAPHRIINRPDGCIETSSKAFLLNLPDLCPDPVLCRHKEEAIELSRNYEIVLKPFYSYCGRGMIRLSTQHCWRENERFDISRLDDFLREDQFPMVAFRFLENVWMGDKRTIVVNQKIMGSALRLPAPGSWMCNVAMGGHAELSEADADELGMEKYLTPLLFRKGIVMYGFDTLVNNEGRRVLSEINTLSIGGLLPLEEMSGQPVLFATAGLLWDYIGQTE